MAPVARLRSTGPQARKEGSAARRLSGRSAAGGLAPAQAGLRCAHRKMAGRTLARAGQGGNSVSSVGARPAEGPEGAEVVDHGRLRGMGPTVGGDVVRPPG